MAKQIKVYPTPDLSQRLTPELLGLAIKARRTQSKLRLEDAAALCNVAKQTLQSIESGLGKSKFETILQICDGLGIQLRIMPWKEEDGEWHG
jgi:transcriptional regulator with XRE-family HTH domain